MTLPLLRAETLGYGATPVLRGVSFALSPGERVVLLGRSGAGKTTLLNALHDRLAASGRRVALVPQEHGLVPQLSVTRNVLMGRLDDHVAARNLLSLLRPGRADRAEIGAILAGLGLGAEADRAVEGLSGGQRQRTALARALFRGGEAIVADEPVSAVDAAQAARLLAEMRARFPAAVVALHDLGLARAFATRLVGLRGGAVAFDAPPESVPEREIEALYAA